MAQARREMAAAALQTMIPSEQNILTRSVIEYELAVNMDHGSDETKAMAKKAAEKQMYINNLRADMEIAAMESQMQKAGGQPGGGAPVGQEGQPQGGNPEQQIESVRPPVRQSERTAGPQPESARQTTPEMV